MFERRKNVPTRPSRPVAARSATPATAVVAAVLTLAVLSLGTLTSCGSSGQAGAAGPAGTEVKTGQPTRGGKLVYGIEGDPNGLDPAKNGWDPSGLLVANAIYDPLAAFDAQGKPQPYLAESITPNADYTQWTARLRPGITFHDGSPLDADALIHWSEAVTSSAITGPAAANVDHTEKVDQLTVKTFMKRPWASYPVLLTGQGGMVAAPAQLDDPNGSLHPIGTGPFKLKEWDVDQQLRVVRNDRYWRKDATGAALPYLEEVEFKPTADGRQRVELLQKGTFNVIHSSDFTTNESLDAAARDGLVNAEHDKGTTEPNFLMFNTATAPFNDLRARQAVAYAIDLDALADGAGWPRERIADGPFPPDSPWAAKTNTPRADPTKARELVDAYRADHGTLAFTLLATSDASSLRPAQIVSEQLARVGIEAKVETVELKQFVIRAVLGSYDAMVFRYFGQPDPDALWHFWSGATARPVGTVSLDFTRLDDPALNEAMQQGRESADPTRRKQAYATAQQRMAELVPYVWFYRTDWVVASGKQVRDLTGGTLPGGQPSMPMVAGIHRLTQAWIDADAGRRATNG